MLPKEPLRRSAGYSQTHFLHFVLLILLFLVLLILLFLLDPYILLDPYLANDSSLTPDLSCRQLFIPPAIPDELPLRARAPTAARDDSGVQRTNYA